MSYSYTEKKRIRKNFGTFAKVMDLPNLVETQTKSYAEFLQADVAPEARKKQGLEDVFKSLFPIKINTFLIILRTCQSEYKLYNFLVLSMFVFIV